MNSITEQRAAHTSIKPFIRWAGGKQSLIGEIYTHVPDNVSGTLFEPFLGGGSFFLNGNFGFAYLSDLNANLINCYNQIKANPSEISARLNSFRIPVSPDLYYKIRIKFNKHTGEESIDQAVRFIFLNKTSFNGIFRVNQSGEYNVPFGKPKPAFPTLEHLTLTSQKLQQAALSFGHYNENKDKVSKGDFIYLDPPYPRLSDTSYFNHYTLDKFDNLEQEKLASYASEMSRKGARILISNADLDVIRDLYNNWNIAECSTYRSVSCKSVKIKVKELIIKNY
ncbi:MAG: Dam family site-specific DNA-(adenine-N6)-methyltransferase [Saprospiraceae bacterium]